MKRWAIAWMMVALVAVAWDRGSSPETFMNVPVELRYKLADYGRTAVFFDCGKDILTIQPGNIPVSNLTMLTMSDTNSPVRQTLDYVEANRDKAFLMVLQRPDSARTFDAVYRMFFLRQLDVAHELADAGVPVEDVVKRSDFSLGPLARPIRRMPVMFECRSNELFYVSNNELAARASRFLERFRPMSRREDIQLAEQALKQTQFADEHYVLDGPAIIMGMVRLQPRPGATGVPVAKLSDAEGKFLKRLRTYDPARMYVQFLVRDDSFELVRQARVVAEKEGFDWRIHVLKPGEALEFQSR